MRLVTFISSLLLASCAGATTRQAVVEDFLRSNHKVGGHTNNWAVLVCSSRYWFNYRHMANALGMYRTVKRLGIPDSQIILMLADDVACNARNTFPATVYSNANRDLDLYGDNIEVDYRGYEVTVENFIRLLTGRVESSVPRSKRLLTDDKSNIFVYMTGHGGNEFLKFQDNEEISAFDIADAFEQMWQKKRYNEILFMIDTCQANTMYSKLYSPNILASGSSMKDENSYSYQNAEDIGVAVIDSYTHYILQYLEGINKTSRLTLEDLFSSPGFTLENIKSTPGVRRDLFKRSTSETLITDFFGGVAQVDILDYTPTAPPPPPPPSLSKNKPTSTTLEPSPTVVDTKNQQVVELIQAPSVPDSNSTQPQEVVPILSTWKTKGRAWMGIGLMGVLVGLVFATS